MIKWILLSIVALFIGYIVWRLIVFGAAISYFQAKEFFYNLKIKKEGGKQNGSSR